MRLETKDIFQVIRIAFVLCDCFTQHFDRLLTDFVIDEADQTSNLCKQTSDLDHALNIETAALILGNLEIRIGSNQSHYSCDFF